MVAAGRSVAVGFEALTGRPPFVADTRDVGGQSPLAFLTRESAVRAASCSHRTFFRRRFSIRVAYIPGRINNDEAHLTRGDLLNGVSVRQRV